MTSKWLWIVRNIYAMVKLSLMVMRKVRREHNGYFEWTITIGTTSRSLGSLASSISRWATRCFLPSPIENLLVQSLVFHRLYRHVNLLFLRVHDCSFSADYKHHLGGDCFSMPRMIITYETPRYGHYEFHKCTIVTRQ